ncbi:phosphoribosylamine--glycine ligase [Lacunimicrobium album]
MKILVIGQGGREHALVWKLAQSPKVTEVYCAPGNAGTAVDAINVPIKATDIPALIKFAQEEKIDLTIPGPEAPLVAGIVDAFKAAGLTVFGPSKAAAELEGSKIFSKNLMRKAKVPTAEFAAFNSAQDALNYLDGYEAQIRKQAQLYKTGEHRSPRKATKSVVVKADGLAAGKGVSVCDSIDEAKDVVRRMMFNKEFGAAGERIVIEEKLEGQEASILALVDGKTIVPLESSQDHKAAYDRDQGPNTGGMGAYSPTPLITDEIMEEIIQEILIPTVHTMRKEDRPFTGILYAGIMLTKYGPKVLEYNVRLGDPETQPILMRLKSDLAELLYAAAKGELHQHPGLEWDPRPAVCVVMAAEGYPGPYENGKEIRGLEEAAQIEDAKVFHAGTKLVDGKAVTDGGRVLGVTALGADLSEAKLKAYQAVKPIRWEGAWCRKDISDKARMFVEREN